MRAVFNEVTSHGFAPHLPATSLKASISALVVGKAHECGFVPSAGVSPPNGTTSAMGGGVLQLSQLRLSIAIEPNPPPKHLTV
jgi:hypothetical protein